MERWLEWLLDIGGSARHILRQAGPRGLMVGAYQWLVKGKRRRIPALIHTRTSLAGTASAFLSGYESTASLTPDAQALKQQLGRALTPYQARGQSYLSILDWHTGRSIAAAVQQHAVFSPLTDEDALPYKENTIDVVIINPTPVNRLAEALRVARYAVLSVDGGSVSVNHVSFPAGSERLTRGYSIIIPQFNHADYTSRCLEQVIATVPRDADVEVIVVDDASTETDAVAVIEKWTANDPRIQLLCLPVNQGYLMACNHAARQASKDVLVFLNNDTLPCAGWLEALQDVFVDRADAGVVGAKLLSSDGRLQEAGAAVFRSGDAMNLGRGEAAASLAFNYLRPVNYVSGALLATSRALWQEIGGFDERFCPLYYEDVDYCFEVRRRGYQVYYQPRCEVIHYEGVTSGTDPAAAAAPKRHQIENRCVFEAKWRDTLVDYPDPPARIDADTVLSLTLHGTQRVKRALICAAELPDFDRQAGSQRLFDMVQMLQELGYSIVMLVDSVTGGERYLGLIQQQGVAVFGGAAMVRSVRALLAAGRFDLVLTVFWNMGERYAEDIRVVLPHAKHLIDSVDLHFVRRIRQSFLTGDGNGMNESVANEMRRELNAYFHSDGVLTVSDKETALLNELISSRQHACTVKLSFHTDLSRIPLADRRGILFVANFRHPPNVDALYYLMQDILPLLSPALLEMHPLYVVGNGLDQVTLPQPWHSMTHVNFVGWVPFIPPYLEAVRLTVVPLRIGAGTKRKLLEALMTGTPSVATSIGVEGMNLQHDRHVLVADDRTAFAEAISQLLTDDGLWRRLVENGRLHALAEQSHDRIFEEFQEALRRVGLSAERL